MCYNTKKKRISTKNFIGIMRDVRASNKYNILTYINVHILKLYENTSVYY